MCAFFATLDEVETSNYETKLWELMFLKLAQRSGPERLKQKAPMGLWQGAVNGPTAPRLWSPAPYRSTGQARRRNDAWGVGRIVERRGRPSPRPCPGFPLSRERRWGVGVGGCCWCRRGAGPLLRDGPLAKGPYGALGEFG